MVKILTILFVLTTGLTAVSPASAMEGCGVGRHRGPLGGCRDNAGVPIGKVCPIGWHLGPAGYCRRN